MPGLVASSPELPALTKPLCGRLLRLEVSHVETALERTKARAAVPRGLCEVLVSLLVAPASRRLALESLISDFGAEERGS